MGTRHLCPGCCPWRLPTGRLSTAPAAIEPCKFEVYDKGRRDPAPISVADQPVALCQVVCQQLPQTLDKKVRVMLLDRRFLALERIEFERLADAAAPEVEADVRVPTSCSPDSR